MTPEQMRRAAAWLSFAGGYISSPEVADLARLLREQAEAMEPTKPRRPVETCPACGGTGWQD